MRDFWFGALALLAMSCGSEGASSTGGAAGGGSACSSDTDCDDGDACNGKETCGGSGTCRAGIPIDLDDGDPCTTDSCDSASGHVTHAPIANCKVCSGDGDCDDGDACTTDHCKEGVCAHDATPGCKACAHDADCGDGRLCRGAICHSFTQVTAGSVTACGVLDDGSVVCWGGGGDGEIGNGKKQRRLVPTDVIDLPGPAIQISLGPSAACATLKSGAVWCWGYNELGVLGNGMKGDREATPAQVTGLSSGTTWAGVGFSHSCTITAGGGVQCWGESSFGELGSAGSCANSFCLTPIAVPFVPAAPAPFIQVGSGAYHSAALDTQGNVYCWGGDGFGECGTLPSEVSPGFKVPNVPPAKQLVVGNTTNCVLTTDARVFCWGSTFPSTPAALPAFAGSTFITLLQEKDICALDAMGGASCQGNNSYGQIGDGTTNPATTPVPVVGLSSGVSWISRGTSMTCAVMKNGGAACWGDNTYGQLGDGTEIAHHAPAPVQ